MRTLSGRSIGLRRGWWLRSEGPSPYSLGLRPVRRGDAADLTRYDLLRGALVPADESSDSDRKAGYCPRTVPKARECRRYPSE